MTESILICLGGLPGSGKRSLARSLAKEHGLYVLDFQAKKRQLFNSRSSHSPEQVDMLQTYLFQQILSEFPTVSKMYPRMITQSLFHRATPRNFFLDAAKAYFDRVEFAWIESVDPGQQFESLVERGILQTSEHGALWRDSVERYFEPLPEGTVTFQNSADDSSPARLWELIGRSKK